MENDSEQKKPMALAFATSVFDRVVHEIGMDVFTTKKKRAKGNKNEQKLQHRIVAHLLLIIFKHIFHT